MITFRGLVIASCSRPFTHLEKYFASYNCDVNSPFARKTTNPLIARPLAGSPYSMVLNVHGNELRCLRAKAFPLLLLLMSRS